MLRPLQTLTASFLLAGALGCAHKPATAEASFKRPSGEVLAAAACGLSDQGYSDIDSNDATGVVHGYRFPDGALGLDSERLFASIQVEKAKKTKKKSRMRISVTPGNQVLISDAEKDELVSELEGAIYRCLYEEENDDGDDGRVARRARR